ncbi:MAG: hypothetical protein PHD37_17490 [Gallionellaceae bacterium]|nr:hypothetical protein [Gallionellaceae bacterium]
MNSPVDQIKRAMNALAYADSGERTVAVSASPSRKWIALGVGDSLPAPVMSYVIGACRRMRADLLLLSVDTTRVRALLEAYLPDLEGVDCQSEELASASTASVLRALNLHRGLLFAVSGTDDDPLRPLLRNRRGSRTPVPVVLVSEKSPAERPAPPVAPRASDEHTQ